MNAHLREIDRVLGSRSSFSGNSRRQRVERRPIKIGARGQVRWLVVVYLPRRKRVAMTGFDMRRQWN